MGDKSGFDPSVSQEAIADTAANLGLAIRVGGRYFPLRDTAYKSLLDRAKINGTALPKLARTKLAEVLNSCLELHKDSALLLIRGEKVSAAHSGDSRDYSILEIDQLLDSLQAKVDERFPGSWAGSPGAAGSLPCRPRWMSLWEMKRLMRRRHRPPPLLLRKHPWKRR